MFSFNSLLYFKTCHLLCKRPRFYRSASKAELAERIFKFSPNHASVVYQIPRIYCISDPFRENSIKFNGLISNGTEESASEVTKAQTYLTISTIIDLSYLTTFNRSTSHVKESFQIFGTESMHVLGTKSSVPSLSTRTIETISSMK